jgi:hypothetical protein
LENFFPNSGKAMATKNTKSHKNQLHIFSRKNHKTTN